MSVADSSLPRVRHRFWIPAIVLLAAGGVCAALLNLPEEQLDEGARNGLLMMTAVGTTALVALWFLLLSGFAWTTRAASLVLILLALGGTVFAMYPKPNGLGLLTLEFNGFMAPNLRFAGGADHNEEIVRHRLTAGTSAGAVDLARVTAGDMPEYRGVHRDGVTEGPFLAPTWSASEPKRLWRQPVGGGYAAFSVIGNWAVTIEQRAGNEAVVCYDASTGQERWVHEYPAFFHETLGGDGPRATPTIHDGKVYSLGAGGELACLDGSSGDLTWRTNVLQLNECENLQWGMSGSPLILDNLVVVTPGTQKGSGSSGAILALDAKDGKVAWKSGQGLGGYSSPMLAELAGERQILSFEGERIASYSAQDGKELWSHPWKSEYDVNAAQPIIVDDRTVFITSNAGCALLEISTKDGKWSATPKWTSRDLKCHYSNPIRLKDHVYGLDNGILACISLEDGKRAWKGGRYGHGQMLLRGSILVLLSEKGEVAMVEATPEKFHELGKIQALDAFKTWNNPALVGNRLLVRNHLEMAGFELPLEKAK